jgi:multiple sugar transport system ATP-binding protein
VQFVEPVGNHQIIWIEHSGLSLAVVVHDAIELNIDGPIRFDIDIDRVSLFDEASEQRL